MKDRSFAEWINFFVTVNLGILTLLMFFVPIYPWWFFAILTLISKFFGPQITLKYKGSKSSNRTRF
jgi:hypothetical protein